MPELIVLVSTSSKVALLPSLDQLVRRRQPKYTANSPSACSIRGHACANPLLRAPAREQRAAGEEQVLGVDAGLV
jgi:hypothetical protein